MRSTKLATVLDHIKLVAALLSMTAIAYLFTFYLDADIGVVVCAFLLIAPAISALLAWAASRRIHARMSAPDTLQKGRHFTVRVELTAEGRLPVPFLRVQFAQDPNFQRDDGRMIQSAMVPAEALEIPCGMTALYSGCGIVNCGKLVVSDYLGLFTFPVKDVPAPVQIGVIPTIPSLTGAALMLRTVSNVVMTMEEDEEESSASFTSQSMPGYVHRDYVPGDNLKRINWKLSAKRRKLMVRMDEAASTVRPTVILDFQHEIEEALLKKRDTMLEGALGFLMLLVRQGVPCSMRFASAGEWKCLELDSEDAVRLAAVEIARADFINGGSRIDPAALNEKAGAYMIYTTRPDTPLSEKLRTLQNEGYVCCIFPAVPEPPAMHGADAAWMLSEDLTMTAVRK